MKFPKGHIILTTICMTILGACAPAAPEDIPPTAALTTQSTKISPSAPSIPANTPAAPKPASTPFGGGSFIAFSSNRDGNYEIYLMNSDGSNPMRLTDSPTQDWFPKLSPSSDLILYWSYQEDPLSYRLIWLQSDGAQSLFSEWGTGYNAFSADGQNIAITVTAETGTLDIHQIEIQSGRPTQLTTHAEDDYQPSWSPDGKSIVFVSKRDGGTHLYLMDSDGSNQRALTSPDLGPIAGIEPAWSPDGSLIAFVRGDEKSTNIFAITPDGSNLLLLTNETDNYNENPVWSPDGTMIAFWSNRSGNKEIYAARLDGSGLVNLTNHPAEDENPSWSK